jgi:hypothetical protein
MLPGSGIGGMYRLYVRFEVSTEATVKKGVF